MNGFVSKIPHFTSNILHILSDKIRLTQYHDQLQTDQLLSKMSHVRLTFLPSAKRQSTTCHMFCFSYKSTVWNRSVLASPYFSHADKKLLMFSICLNGTFILLCLAVPGPMICSASLQPTRQTTATSGALMSNLLPLTRPIYTDRCTLHTQITILLKQSVNYNYSYIKLNLTKLGTDAGTCTFVSSTANWLMTI